VSPWIEPGSVYNEEYRHTSLLATLREVWGLGDPFTQRDAAARTFHHVFTRDVPRDPGTWPTITPRPVPDWTMDAEVLGQGLSTLGKGAGPALVAKAEQMGVALPPGTPDAAASLAPERIVPLVRAIAANFFPLLADDARDAG
jgi:phospholipase C